MTDKEYSIFRKNAAHLFRTWKLRLGLGSWGLELNLYREPCSDDSSCRGKMTTFWMYKSGVMRLYAPLFMDEKVLNLKQLEQTIVHEFCHVLVAEMREYGPINMESEALHKAMSHEERVVTQLTDAILWSYDDGTKAGKRA